jgi:N-formylglutamate deformylase
MPMTHTHVEILGDGSLPVVVHVPHAGLRIPPDVRDGLLLDDAALAEELRLMTDHRTDVLAQGAVEAGATVFLNRLSRLVVDPERFLEPDKEDMESRGMGAVYTATAHQSPLRDIDDDTRTDLINTYFHPYATALAVAVDRMLQRHGHVTIVDLHSYPSQRLPYEVGGEHRPPLCIGTDLVSTPDWLVEVVEAVAVGAGIETARNTPFAGTYVPLRHLGHPEVASVMLEIRRDLYLDEAAWLPHADESSITEFVTSIVVDATSAREQRQRR